MAIKEFVSLEGVDEVLARYKELQTGGESTARAISDIGKGEGLAPVTVNIQQARAAMAEAEGSTRGLTEAMHILRPALEEAGLHMANMRELSVLARLGIEGLALALGGAFVIAALRASEAVSKLQTSFQFLFDKTGTNALDNLKKSADELGISVEKLAPALQAALTAATAKQGGGNFVSIDPETSRILNSLPGLAAKATEAVAVLARGMLNLRLSSDEAAKAAFDVFATISKVDPSTGKAIGLTLQGLEELKNKAPLAEKFIEDALGPNVWERLRRGPISFAETIDAINAKKISVEATPIPASTTRSVDEFKKAWEGMLEILGRKTEQAVTIALDQLERLNKTKFLPPDELTALGGPTIDEFKFALLKDRWKTITDLIKQSGDAAKKAGNDSAQGFMQSGNAAAQATGSVSGFASANEAASAAIKSGYQDIIRAGQASDTYAQAQNKLAAQQRIAATIAAGLVPTARDITEAYQGFIPTAKSVETGLQGIGKSAQQAAREITTININIPGLADIGEKIAKGIQDGMQQASSSLKTFDITAVAKKFNESVSTMLQGLQTEAERAGSELGPSIDQGLQETPPNFDQIVEGLTAIGPALVEEAQSIWNSVAAVLSKIITIPTKIAPPSGGGGGGGGEEIRVASGGLISGPGSSTSDSILARLSNWEYVMRAAAVRFYGVDFMHALNAMRLPKDFFRGFNLGGLVLPPFPSPPRFAQGGLAMAGQNRSLTLVLDGRSFAVAGSKNVVDDLERAADLHNLSRMGRAPGWVR